MRKLQMVFLYLSYKSLEQLSSLGLLRQLFSEIPRIRIDWASSDPMRGWNFAFLSLSKPGKLDCVMVRPASSERQRSPSKPKNKTFLPSS